MVNKFFVSNNHYSLVTSKFSKIKKTFYLVNQLLLLMCLPNVNITRITASEDIEIIPHWFFGGIISIFKITSAKSIPKNCAFFVNKTTPYTFCRFIYNDLYFGPAVALPFYGDIDIILSWELEEGEPKLIIKDLERRLVPSFFLTITIYCCIKGLNLTFNGSNFYSLFKLKIEVPKHKLDYLCTVLDNYTLTCDRPLFESTTEQWFRIYSHNVPISASYLIIEPLPHFIWVISRPQLSVIIEPKWVEFVDPVIIKVYRSSTDLLIECNVQVDLQSDWLTCDELTPKEDPSTLSCVVTFGTETIPATADTTNTTFTTQSDDTYSIGSSTVIIIIILVVLISTFLAWTVYLFHANRLLTRKLSSASLSTLSTLSSISRIPYITVTSKDTHELTKFTLDTLSSRKVSLRSGKNLKKKGGPPTK